MRFVSGCVHYGSGPRCLGVSSRRSVVSACGFRPGWGLSHGGISRWRASRVRAVPENSFPGKEERGAMDRRDVLLEYVRDVEPDVLEEFTGSAPTQVIEAMRHTITNMLGSLPPQFFDVKVSTMGENLSQLMFSVMMTGYMLRNAQYRMELSNSLGVLPAPDAVPAHEEIYAAAAQTKDVQGKVLRWHNDLGAESMPAVQYIEQLESELSGLRHQLEQQRSLLGQNGLLDYIKTLDGHSLKELTTFAEEDVLLAMNVFIQRMLGTDDVAELRETTCDSSALELARLLYWLMVVGYNLRSMEVRFDMEKTFTLPELPSGK